MLYLKTFDGNISQELKTAKKMPATTGPPPPSKSDKKTGKNKKHLKTKNVVKTLTSFKVFPGGEGGGDGGGGGGGGEDFGGDLLPEAIVVKNILEGMFSSLLTLMKLKVLLLKTEGEEEGEEENKDTEQVKGIIKRIFFKKNESNLPKNSKKKVRVKFC